MAISFKDKIAYVNKFADKGDDKLQKVIKLSVNIDSPKLNLTDVQKDKIKASLQVAFDRIRKIQQGTTQATKKPMLNLNALAKQIKEREGITFDQARIKAKKAFEAKKNGQLDAVKKVLQDFKNKVGKIDYKRATTNTDIKRDMERPALRAGKRKVTTDGYTTNAYGTFKNKIGKVYYESRANRMDVNQPSKKRYPKLAEGGMMKYDNGGNINKQNDKNYQYLFQSLEAELKALKRIVVDSEMTDLTMQQIQKIQDQLKNQYGTIVTIEDGEIVDVKHYAKGGRTSGEKVAYIHFLKGFSESHIDEVYDMLQQEGIKVDGSKKWHTKGYAEELEDESGVDVRFHFADANNPRKLIEDLREYVSKNNDYVDLGMSGGFAKGGAVEGNFEVINFGGDRYDGGVFYEIKQNGKSVQKGLIDGDLGIDYKGKHYDGLLSLSKALNANLVNASTFAKGGMMKYSEGGSTKEEISTIFSDLKKGDKIDIFYGDSISRNNKKTLKVKSKNVVGKGKSFESEKITFENVENPSGVNFYAYKDKGGYIGFAVGDMAISVMNIKHHSSFAEGGMMKYANGGGIGKSKKGYVICLKPVSILDGDEYFYFDNTSDAKSFFLNGIKNLYKYKSQLVVDLSNQKSRLFEIKKDSTGIVRDEKGIHEAFRNLANQESFNNDYLRIRNQNKSTGDTTAQSNIDMLDYYDSKISSEPTDNDLVEYPQFDDEYYAKGGMVEHGLKNGDKIISGKVIGTTVRVRNEGLNEDARVDLNTGKRTILVYDKKAKKFTEM